MAHAIKNAKSAYDAEDQWNSTKILYVTVAIFGEKAEQTNFVNNSNTLIQHFAT